MTPQILCIPPNLTGAVSERVGSLMDRGLLAAHENDRDGIMRDLESGRTLMWLVLDGNTPMATALTEITSDDAGTVWVFGLAGRDLHSWVKGLVQRLTVFARKENCTRIRFAGKPGWKRFVPDAEIVGSVNGHIIFERIA